ncbi:restriction endonuclease [Streptomyces chartreusis]|uniref:restriction endonuclease n=1 Tax=Streptomyces chartreusis TaxID=1969 RepID=UPI002E7FD04E|nr:restriction endonuclease [Streptomyces chartreusis]WUB23247.1 restriction endonuclease [Streptomyces chartreusis]
MMVQTVAVLGRLAVRLWPLLLVLAAMGLGYGLWRLRRAARARRVRAGMLARLHITVAEFDAMNDRQFEQALCDVLIRDGWRARQVGRAGDQGADVIAEHPVLGRLVVQAKHTTTAAKVGSPVLYQLNGTAGPVHRADLAAVITNGRLTRDAQVWGERHRIYWVDRDRLRQWAEHGVPLQGLLRLAGRAGRRSPRGLLRTGRARAGG